ncbi:hypothetical protein BJX61DRAFT_546602 [Aspergillus egyptiacus]|nr:hypothetical protein BJX61DRAFT_546602 [Aspergillus egyptiacus]
MTTTTSISISASPVITTFFPEESSVVGYYSSGTDVATIVCGDPEYAFQISGNYGVCCPTSVSGRCHFEQSCSGTAMIQGPGTTVPCDPGVPCVTTTLFQREPADGWYATMAWCQDPDNPTTIYRSFVATDFSLVPVIVTVTDEPTTTSGPTSSGAVPPTTPNGGEEEPTNTNPPIPPPDDDDGPNVGAIAGGVVGGVAGLALIILAVWLILRRQRKKNAELREIGTTYVAPEAK